MSKRALVVGPAASFADWSWQQSRDSSTRSAPRSERVGERNASSRGSRDALQHSKPLEDAMKLPPSRTLKCKRMKRAVHKPLGRTILVSGQVHSLSPSRWIGRAAPILSRSPSPARRRRRLGRKPACARVYSARGVMLESERHLRRCLECSRPLSYRVYRAGSVSRRLASARW